MTAEVVILKRLWRLALLEANSSLWASSSVWSGHGAEYGYAGCAPDVGKVDFEAAWRQSDVSQNGRMAGRPRRFCRPRPPRWRSAAGRRRLAPAVAPK
jgi:hypothetical protein